MQSKRQQTSISRRYHPELDTDDLALPVGVGRVINPSLQRRPLGNLLKDPSVRSWDVYMSDFITTPSGVKILNITPIGDAGQALNDNFNLLGNRSSGFIFVQSTPATVWRMQHNLGKSVAITLTDADGFVVYGDLRSLDLNTVEATFNEPFAGRAYIS